MRVLVFHDEDGHTNVVDASSPEQLTKVMRSICRSLAERRTQYQDPSYIQLLTLAHEGSGEAIVEWLEDNGGDFEFYLNGRGGSANLEEVHEDWDSRWL